MCPTAAKFMFTSVRSKRKIVSTSAMIYNRGLIGTQNYFKDNHK
jgi:hypothetical protein